MNRHLHHTLTALLASAILTLGLVAATTDVNRSSNLAGAQLGAASQATPSPIPRQPGDAGLPVVDGQSVSFQHDAPVSSAPRTTRSRAGRTNRMRQSMAMPFFSFAPRG